jgi:hypothetical protein
MSTPVLVLVAATLGLVRDESCAPLGGVAVLAYDAEGRTVAETTTDTAGVFRLAVPAERIRFELFGFAPVEQVAPGQALPPVQLSLTSPPGAAVTPAITAARCESGGSALAAEPTR